LYNPNSVPSFFIKEASFGTVKINKYTNGFGLYNNDKQWMCYLNHDSVIKEMYSSYDLAHGDVIVSGLGFGILALWLCSKEEVDSVTVIEFSSDVIKLFKDSNSVPDKLNIVNADIRSYNTDIEYDVMLLDHHELEDFDFRLFDIEEICNRIKHKYMWSWSLELMYIFKMYANEDHKIQQSLWDDLTIKCDKDFSTLWNDFVDNFFPEEKMLKNISNQKINEYVYTYYSPQFTKFDFLR
jgi:hypothetical protein